MTNTNIVFIATSLDGFIADKNGGIDWLNMVPNPDQIDMGYGALMERVDALVMGRATFETVCDFDIEWPYTKPVFVVSNSLDRIPEKFEQHAELIQGSNIQELLEELNERGYHCLYIDGGKLIQSFLKEDRIDELIVTTIPVLLGGGSSLFAEMPEALNFKLKASSVFLGELVQSVYVRDVSVFVSL